MKDKKLNVQIKLRAVDPSKPRGGEKYVNAKLQYFDIPYPVFTAMEEILIEAQTKLVELAKQNAE